MFASFIFYFFVCEKVIGLKVIICIQGHTAVAQISNFTIFLSDTKKSQILQKLWFFVTRTKKRIKPSYKMKTWKLWK